MHSLHKNTTVKDALDEPKTLQHTRIPVYRDSHDDIIGMVTHREMMLAEREGKPETQLHEMAKPITRVSESLPVHMLLDQFIKKQEHFLHVG